MSGGQGEARSMAPADRVHAIVEQGLCIGCGLCRVVAPEAIEIGTGVGGFLRPWAGPELTDAQADTIHDVCPGTRIDGLADALVTDGTTVDPVWGPWRVLAHAWAAEPAVRFEGSTGGVLTALGQYLLRSERVAFVLHTRASTAEPTFGEATISTTEAEVLAAAGSRYGPTDTLSGITDALDRDEPFAFIGKPCDVTALNNLARHDPRVDRLVRYRLAPVCGGFGPPAFTDRFLGELGVTPDEVTGFRYRGRGCPGPTTVHIGERAIDRHYLDYWGDDESQWSLPWRCKICPDGIGEACDLVAADTWLGGSPAREETDDDPGTNAVMARTEAGAELFEAAVRDGALETGRPLTIEQLSAYQPHQVRKKQVVVHRYAGLAEVGRIVPVTQRLRLEELGAEVDAEVQDAQRAGTVRRVVDGKASG